MKIEKRQLPLVTMLRSRRYLVLSVVSWLIMVLLLVLVVIPRIQMVLTLRSSSNASKLALEKLQDKATFLESFKNSEFDTLNSKVQRILPSNKPFLQMLATLEQLSSEQGVYFAGLDVNPGVIATESAAIAAKDAKDGISTLGLELTIFGSSTQISGFMDKIPSIAPALDVKTFSSTVRTGNLATQATTGGAEAIYEANISLASLFAPIVGAASITQSLPTLTKDEIEYTKTIIPTYIIYSSTATVPQTGEVGKLDPFAP